MIKVSLPRAEYTEDIVQKGDLYCKYICPTISEDTVSAYELAFSHYPTAEEIEAAKAREIPFYKSVMISNIEAHDSSSAVNGFLINDNEVWVDRTVRASQMTAILSAEILEKSDVTLAFGGVSYTLAIADAKEMLATIESYALDVNNVTIAHKNTIMNSNSLEAILAFDYTNGYPEKPSFELS